jgi:hypothetical protein
MKNQHANIVSLIWQGVTSMFEVIINFIMGVLSWFMIALGLLLIFSPCIIFFKVLFPSKNINVHIHTYKNKYDKKN